MLRSAALVLLFAAMALAAVPSITFTGNALTDFTVTVDPAKAGVITVQDPPNAPDVGLPPQVTSGRTDAVSGWDINRIFMQYNPDTDVLSIGIECYAICGDADGLDGPDKASDALSRIGGVDLPNLAQSESFAVIMALGADEPTSLDEVAKGTPPVNQPTHIIGVPGGKSIVNQATDLECSVKQPIEELKYRMGDCFGLYTYHVTAAVVPAYRFIEKVAAWNDIVNYGQETITPLSDAAPHLEWGVPRFSELKTLVGQPFPSSKERYGPFKMWIKAFAGSFQDAGIGEEFIPNQNDFMTVEFPCINFDPCDVCLGDGSTCGDCKGIPGGPNQYDVCDVCGGDGKTCADCKGVPNGNATYDKCDICDGADGACKDCKGMPNGKAVYDTCDVCGGDGTSCLPPPALCSSSSEIMTSEGSCESVSSDDDDSSDSDDDDDDE